MKIKIRRIEKGIKQYELAKYLGISRNTMVKIEKDAYPNISLGLMKKISVKLEIPIEELFL